jgi:peptidyl-dipeptidase Dcp
LSEFGNDITLNADLFAKVKAIYEQKKLESQSRKTTLLDKKYKVSQKRCQFANKKNSSRNRQRTIEDSLKFGENVLAETQGFQLHIINEKTCQVYRKEPSKQLGP